MLFSGIGSPRGVRRRSEDRVDRLAGAVVGVRREVAVGVERLDGARVYQHRHSLIWQFDASAMTPGSASARAPDWLAGTPPRREQHLKVLRLGLCTGLVIQAR